MAALSVAFPEGGSEPFTWATLWPIPAIALVALVLIPKRHVTLLAGIALYALGCIAAFKVATPVGSNAARLGPLLAGPLVALLWYPRHKTLAGRWSRSRCSTSSGRHRFATCARRPETPR